MLRTRHERPRAFLPVLRAAALALMLSLMNAAHADPLTLAARIALPDVRGRIDHLAVDPAGGRLFVAALGAGSVEVVDLKAGRRVERLQGLREPQGVAYAAERGRLFVANAGGGVDVFEGSHRVAHIGALEDADNLRLDAAGGDLYVGYGAALARIDTRTLEVVQRIPLPAHPESFELATADDRIFVNVPGTRQVVVVDRRQGKVITAWPIGEASRNFPMALDEASHRVFVGTRSPPLLLVFDSRSGERGTQLPTCGDADDLLLDAKRARLYVICGEGRVDVVRMPSPTALAPAGSLSSSPGARTGLFVVGLDTLFVAVPAHGPRQAEVDVFRAD